jgi:hypothetical protein
MAKVGPQSGITNGYYFVPPLEKKTEPWTWQLPGS